VPDALVLLDEIEKAHPDVFKKFLTAWNDGHVTEASTGAQISTTHRRAGRDRQSLRR
jgi:ATP-dependent Clp protease ATP-binding subunit ClpA